MPSFGRISKSLALTLSVFFLGISGCTGPRTPPQEQSQQGQAQPAQKPAMESQQAQEQDAEVQMGEEVFNELKAKGEIVESSPLYDELKPIAEAITRAAQPQYNHPFKFYLVHEKQPNAFATPGGNVYVVDSLLYFVKNKEQLAGTLCHEVSHTIHHDTMELMEKQAKIERRELGAALLLGPTRAHLLAIALIGKLHSLGYSRGAEQRADLTGSDICAQTGYNPWGLIWLFQDFQAANPDQLPQLLSDHPDDQNRIAALKRHFRQNPSVFGKFSPDPKTATSMTVPKNASEVFLH
ncbi:M48 family metallopeptidase [Edaphobacter aggregans]|uniref:M48 family metallopeptidase n=1 Tax=Edaphobacter aggregans TaxID=570835 RepID=UPI00068F6B11|nr:M48 family metallopeptidase [Edaphobacter aggregans]